MMAYSRMFFGAVLAAAFLAVPARGEDGKAVAYYNYAHNEAEYSVTLPEAPTVKTIWAEEGDVPYLRNPPKYGAVGEIATFKRVDINTEDSFEVNIYFLRADKEFLSWLNEERMKKVLKSGYSKILMSDGNLAFSEGNGGLKWASLTGFSVERNRPIFNAMHYLTGQQSIQVIRIRYSVENGIFQEYYETLIKSISYLPP
ncbi:MAG: hypothetical protein V1721_04425 [Pseudomonadota bacterium]